VAGDFFLRQRKNTGKRRRAGSGWLGGTFAADPIGQLESRIQPSPKFRLEEAAMAIYKSALPPE